MWPREHGAYVQLLGPLLSALLFAPTLPGLVWSLGAWALFLAHEPFLILLGRRGERARAAEGPAARRHLLARSSAAAIAALATGWVATGWTHAALLIAGCACAGASLLVLADREKTLSGELLVPGALSSLALPVLALAQVSTRQAVQFAGGWLLVHAMATLAARAYVYRKRDGGSLLHWAALASVAIVAVSSGLFAVGLVSPALAALPLPFALVTAVLWAGVYRPRTPKGVGWTLTVANLLAFALLGLTVRGVI